MTEVGRDRLRSLPDRVRARLDELERSLSRALGSGLSGLVVHGSVARGAYREGESDVDLIVILTEATRERLDAIANPLAIARNAARIEAMILAKGEVARAADVFPLLYDDIRRCHVTLTGEDPFEDLVVSDHNLRLRVEQELREAQIRLRRAVVDSLGAPRALEGAVSRKVKQIRGPLHALVRLGGKEAGDDLPSVLKAAGALLGVDTGPLTRLSEPGAEGHAALAALLDAAVDAADRLEPEAHR